jgi:hypothetical protein
MIRELAIDLALFAFVVAVCLYAGVHRPSRPSEARVVLSCAIVVMVLPTAVLWIWFSIASPGKFSVLEHLLFMYQPEVKSRGRLLLPVQYGLLIMAIVGWVRTRARLSRADF